MSEVSNFISRRFNSGKALPRSVRAMRIIAITGIVISVAALVIAVAVGRGFETEYKKALIDFNAHVAIISSTEITHPQDVFGGLKALHYVAVTPFLYREALAVGNGNIRGVVVKGIDPVSFTGVHKMKFELIGDLAHLDEVLKKDGGPRVILGRSLAHVLGAPDGGEIRLLVPKESDSREKAVTQEFVTAKVVGTFESGMHDYDDQFLLMSLGAARRLFGVADPAISGVEVRLADPDTAGPFSEAIIERLGPAYRALPWSELNQDLLAAVRLEKFVSALIMGIMVVVAALNIVAVLVLLTIHKLSEISVLKAIGARRKFVGYILMRGGLGLTISGVALGLGLGIGILLLVSRFHLIRLEPEIYLIGTLPIDISPMICGMLALICLAAGFLTSWMASRGLVDVPIIEGLRGP